jgi:hypothetical protein
VADPRVTDEDLLAANHLLVVLGLLDDDRVDVDKVAAQFAEAREAGRREGLDACIAHLDGNGSTGDWAVEELRQLRRALIGKDGGG